MLKKTKPITPGQRHKVLIDKSTLSKKIKLIKRFSYGLSKKGGRNKSGKITVRHKGGGNKRTLRLLDFNYIYLHKEILSIEYDPNRSGHIAKFYDLKYRRYGYMLLPENVHVGQRLKFIKNRNDNFKINPGDVSTLKNVPLNFLIHNIENIPGKGAQFVRSAGTFAKIIDQDFKKGLSLIKLPSGKLQYFSQECKCTLGVVSNLDHQNQVFGKAGKSRWLGIRPTVRGVAMNPVDHPHGGGEGKTSGGRPSVSPWGVITKGKPTRKKK